MEESIDDPRQLPVLRLRNKADDGEGPLSKGSKGELVELLHKMLFDLSYNLGDSGIDGIFGDLTEKAVAKFQKIHKDWNGKSLKSDGLVGPKTSDSLNRAMVGVWYPDYTTQPEATKDKDTLYVTATKDALKKTISLNPKDAKRVKLVLVEQHHVPIAKRPGPSLEKSWSIEHKEGFVDLIGPDNIILWNFDVGSAELKPEHKKELDSIAKIWGLRPLDVRGLSSDFKIFIDGHASRSGSEGENEIISISRASAVDNYLLNKGVNYERIGKIDWHGFSMPWFPNMTGGSMARNRRVEISLLEPEMHESKDKDSLEPPIILESRPGEPGTEVKIIQTPKLGDKVPNISFEVKIPLQGPPRPLGQDFIIYPGGDFAVKLKLKTPTPVTNKLALDLKKGKLTQVLEYKLNEYIKIKEEGGGETGKFALSFYKIPLKPEVEWNLVEVIKSPISINFIPWSGQLPDIDLGDGLEFEVEGELKAKFGLGFSPGLMLRLGSAGIIVSGTIIGTVALTYAAAKIVEDAQEKGIELGRKVTRRDAYAWRIAGEATRGYAGFLVAEEYFNTYTGKRRDGSKYAIPGSEYAIDGWTIADKAIKDLSQEQLNVLFKTLRERNNFDINRIKSEIFYKVGGLSHDDTVLLNDIDLECLLGQ